MSNDDRSGFLANPLPIVMVVLAAAGVLVRTVPLQSARPVNSERVKFAPASKQDIEARLWQDPFAAIEKHEKASDQDHRLKGHEPGELAGQIRGLPAPARRSFAILAVNVFGGSFEEASEFRRRARFAVVAALGFHHFNPKNADAIGYFVQPEDQPIVPYEWFATRDESSWALVLWLNEDKLTTEPLRKLKRLVASLASTGSTSARLDVKLIGPARSDTLKALLSTLDAQQLTRPRIDLDGGNTLEVYSPSATVSDCDLDRTKVTDGSVPSWDCFAQVSGTRSPFRPGPIVRTTGTDDVLAAALLWELQQRGINSTLAKDCRCEDGLVLVGERDTEYGRTLLRYLNDGFVTRCPINSPPPVRTFTYLRGLDGILPDAGTSESHAPSKDDKGDAKGPQPEIRDAPPEHAEGRSQFDYLRRLADEIDRLDADTEHFTKKGVKAIGIVGSDVYDKLLVLQALRARFKDKIFFTTDLDARYLHADQKEWARNLVVASNFGLSLRPALQMWTLPFRDSYQTATYLATLVALGDPPGEGWSAKMSQWLRPKLFEIGRTEAVYLASPSVERLRKWKESNFLTDPADEVKDSKCDEDWWTCTSIEPIRPVRGLPLSHLPAALLALGLGSLSIALASRWAQEALRSTYGVLTGSPNPERRAVTLVLIAVASLIAAVFATVWKVNERLNASLKEGVAEPFLWLEGVSVWPSLVLRFIGLIVTILLVLALVISLRLRARKIGDRFDFPPPEPAKLARNWWSALRFGPHLDLAAFDEQGIPISPVAGGTIKVRTLWQNYIRATSGREMTLWIVCSVLLAIALGFVAFRVLGGPSFPHRGTLVKGLHIRLLLLNVPVLWLVIFWVGYEIRACARFIAALAEARTVWPDRPLEREATRTGLPRGLLGDYLDFRLIVDATRRIQWLIYLPFVSILFMVLARSDFFDTMDFPLALLFVTGLALAYALQGAVQLRRCAESARARALEHYERHLLTLAPPKDGPDPARPPVREEQIKIVMERIRSTREGAFASFAQQPALRALLLPFGGYGGVQLLQYLFKL